jgi:hypothetical protein
MSNDRSGLVITSQGVKSGCPAQLETTQIPQFSLQISPSPVHGPSFTHDTWL